LVDFAKASCGHDPQSLIWDAELQQTIAATIPRIWFAALQTHKPKDLLP